MRHRVRVSTGWTSYLTSGAVCLASVAASAGVQAPRRSPAPAAPATAPMTAGTDSSFAAVQKHVAVLERAGLVTKERRGREQLVSGRIDTVRAVARSLQLYEEIWRGRIGRMEEILAEPPGEADR